MNSHGLLEICSKHPEFDRGAFMDEGRAMRDAGILDQFYALCDKFFAEGSKMRPGNVNRCNSLFAWWAGMTTKKPDGPLAPGEKMTATRISPPDVDTDFDYFRRDEVYRHLVETYKEENTCNIGTYNELKAASTIRGVGKVQDIGGDWEQKDGEWVREGNDKKPGPKTLRRVDELTKLVMGTVKTIEEAFKLNPLLEVEMRKHPGLIEACKHIQGRISHAGVHPAGIIVSSRRIREMVPIRSSGGTVCSQYSMNEMEALGLLKFDILALKTLTVIETCLKMIKGRHGKEIDIDLLVPTDQEVFDMLNLGFTKGIFQMEGGRFTEMVKNIHVTDFEDMVASTAIYRPGPLGGKVDVLYADLKHGRSEVKYDHPSLQAALNQTYGLIIYQEQIMQISRLMCGFTGPEADKLRKVIGKKIKEEMPALREKFVKRGVENGVQKEVVERTWQNIEFFGDYGFNRSVDKDTKVDIVNGEAKSIKDVVPGEFVWCFDGNRLVPTEVVANHDHGTLPAFEVEFDDGTIEVCSIRHKFLTKAGQRPLYEILSIGLEVIGYESKTADLLGVRARIQNSERVSGAPSRMSACSGKGARQSCHGEQEALFGEPCVYLGRDARENQAESYRKNSRSSIQSGALKDIGSAKSNSGISRQVIAYGQENLISARDFGATGRAACGLAKKQSGKVSSNRSEDAGRQEGSSIGKMVAGERAVRVGLYEGEAGALRREVEAGGFCQVGFLDRSGWVLALWKRLFGASLFAGENSRARSHAKQRGRTSRDNASASRGGLLASFREKGVEGRMESFVGAATSAADSRGVYVRRVLHARFVGFRQMRDLEVYHPAHNFRLASGLITSNSHAACYAYIAYQTAWLKRYYRHEFMACLLTSELGDDKKVGEYISEARRLGVRVLAPSINRSGRTFDIQEDGDIRAPLTIVKGVGDKAVSVIVDARNGSDFLSLRDFVVRTNSREVTSKMVELLIDAGCFACFDADKEALKLKFAALKKEIKTQKFDPKVFSGGAETLFGSTNI